MKKASHRNLLAVTLVGAGCDQGHWHHKAHPVLPLIGAALPSPAGKLLKPCGNTECCVKNKGPTPPYHARSKCDCYILFQLQAAQGTVWNNIK